MDPIQRVTILGDRRLSLESALDSSITSAETVRSNQSDQRHSWPHCLIASESQIDFSDLV